MRLQWSYMTTKRRTWRPVRHDTSRASAAAICPACMGVEILKVGEAGVESRLAVRREVHGAQRLSTRGDRGGARRHELRLRLRGAPAQGAKGFTTVELKTNFLGTAREGAILCRATPVHLGRTTQVWDAV